MLQSRSRTTSLTALAGLVAALAAPVPATAKTAAEAPGIDISTYQDVIDWEALGGGHVRFAITRASHGLQADDMYAVNRQGAEDQGIFFGAYHYAEPKGTTAQAIKQADFFVATAKPRSGDLLPVLDIEQTNGKSPGRLTAWVAAWLHRVKKKTGVKPMIYTSPTFWRVAMDDTKRFARGGFPLWVAHWQTHRPIVPAGNWAGRGWSFWQWTNCRSVRGIEGCVDGDRSFGGNLRKRTIP